MEQTGYPEGVDLVPEGGAGVVLALLPQGRLDAGVSSAELGVFGGL
jgi:hypothetical protein